MRLRAVAVLLSLLPVHGVAAVAASISSTASFPSTTEPYTESLTLSQFNPALGTLTSIDFSLTETAQGSVSFTNNDNVTHVTTTPVEVFLTLERPDMSTLVANTNSATFIATLGPGDGTTFSFLPDPTTTTATLNPVTLTDLALFSGTGSVILPLVASAFGEPEGPISSGLSLDLQVAASATVTYDYTPTPLPPAWTMLLSGVLGFGFIARRGKNSVAARLAS
jgi:hypothetical protein